MLNTEVGGTRHGHGTRGDVYRQADQADATRLRRDELVPTEQG
jgi:hypothetical protein